MGYDKRFTQKDYHDLVDKLDEALHVFECQIDTKEGAEAAFKDFILNHYFPVWRAMSPK